MDNVNEVRLVLEDICNNLLSKKQLTMHDITSLLTFVEMYQYLQKRY